MILQLHKRTKLRKIVLYPALLLLFTATVVSCNVNGDGIFRSIARAPEISKEIKEVLGMTASGIIGTVTDSTDSSRYLLVHKGSAVYAYSFSDPEAVSWKRIKFEDAGGDQIKMGGEFHLTDDGTKTKLHYVKKSAGAEDDYGNETFTSFFSFDISSVLGDSFASDAEAPAATITVGTVGDDGETETSLSDGSYLEFFDAAEDMLFYLSADTDGSFTAAALDSGAITSPPIDLQDVSRFHASKIDDTYYLFISGEETSLVLPYTSSDGFSTAEGITSSLDDESGSEITGCLSAAADGKIYLTAGNYLYSYDGTGLKKLDADTVYPDDFNLSDAVYTAADADEDIIYVSGSSALYALSKSDTAGDDITYEISEEARNIAGGIQDLYFDAEDNVLYLAKGNSWIWKFDPAAAEGDAFSQLF